MTRFEWDPNKDASNQEKHGIAFGTAMAVFDDPRCLDDDSTRPEHGEARRRAIGTVEDRVLTVVYTDRGDRRRIIAARRARRYERHRYDHRDATA
jgi:uncharacterized DUF497 family protein